MAPDSRPVLITGSTGQLGGALARLGAGRGLALAPVGRPVLDFDRPDSIAAAFRDAAPRLVVNAAAYTAVDKAETDADAAWRANRDGPAQLASLCAQAGVPLIHVSTDYVFDGAKGAPYVETDPTAPTGVYGASKLAGEQAVVAASGQAAVLRTSWVYAATGRNFVRTMLAAGAKNPALRVVADQRGCPTAAADLAAAILDIVAQIDRSGWQSRFAGIFHAAGAGETTWHGLACAVFEEASRHDGPHPDVVPIRAADWPTPARRPADSRLDCGRLKAVFGIALPPWRDGLARTIGEIYASPRPSGA